MSLLQLINDLDVNAVKGVIPDQYTDSEKRLLLAKIKNLVSPRENAKQATQADLIRLLELLEESEKREDYSGFRRMFQPGPYGIENLPKHKAFFDATRIYREVMMLGGNRCGKTTNGAVAAAILATGEYPDWWEGVVYECPTSIWAVGKTGQSTRDTVQEALMGPIGAWGTGALPADSIVSTTARQGIPGALDTIQVKSKFGGVSTIGLKSYDQKPQSFVGTHKHLVWCDEPAPEYVLNECLIRTLKLKVEPLSGPAGGRLIYTQTPKEGLTRGTAEFLASCDLLMGAERIKGLDAMLKLQEMEDAKQNESGI